MKKLLTKPGNITILFHVLIWSILILLPYFVSNATNDYRVGSIPGVLFSITGFIHMAIFYGNAYYLYPKFLNRSLWWLYIVFSFLLVLASFQLKYLILVSWFPITLEDTTALRIIFGPSIAVYFISIVYRRVIDQIRLERELKEKEAVYFMTQLKFLRSQVNPHFLFNVLTNLVSLARKKSDKLEQSLIMLSDLMRYMLYDIQGKKVELSKEVEYLNSYIQLQKLRFGNDVLVDCKVELDKADNCYTLEPMLLIPFVENAFKHGTNHPTQPWITIHLSVKNGTMLFKVCNSYEPLLADSKDENAGIGLSNVKERLDLLYKGNYTLTITNSNNTFQTALTLDLI